MYDVLVVGAGPTGSYIAGEMAAQGYKVLVLERNKKIGKATCCTGIVGKECLDAFPVGREAVLREAKSATLFAPFGGALRLEKETTQAYIMDRHAFDSAMAGKAQEEGAEYLLDTRVKDIALDDGFARLDVEREGGSEVFEGKTVVIASGFGSKLPQSLGLGQSSDFVMGAQAEVETGGLDEVEVYFGSHIAPGFFAWLVPTSPGRALAGLLSRHNTGSYLRSFLNELFEQGKIACPDVEIKFGGVPLRPLPKTSLGRLLVVGDAAGQVKPLTGGGIYYGLISARAAAGTLHEALAEGDFSAGAFSLYEKRWKKRLYRELRVDYYARRLFEKLDDRQIDRTLHKLWTKGIHERLLSSSDFSFDWHSRLLLKGLRHLGLRGTVPLLWYLLLARLPGSPSSSFPRRF